MNPASERKPVEFYLAKKYPFVVYPSREGGYSAEVPDLPGCLSEGEDLEELSKHIEEARRLWIEVAYEEGLDIPLPRNEEFYSGRFVVRLPKYLHRRLAEESEREGVSLNQLINSFLSARLAERETMATVKKVIGETISGASTSPSLEHDSFSWEPTRTGKVRSPHEASTAIHLVEDDGVAA